MTISPTELLEARRIAIEAEVLKAEMAIHKPYVYPNKFIISLVEKSTSNAFDAGVAFGLAQEKEAEKK